MILKTEDAVPETIYAAGNTTAYLVLLDTAYLARFFTTQLIRNITA